MRLPGRPFIRVIDRPGGLAASAAFFPPSRMETKKNKSAPDSVASATQDASQRPIKSFRVDDCSLSVWARERNVNGEPVVFYSATLERSYKDKSGAFKYSKSFDAASLSKLVTLCQQASEFIDEQTP